ncbi:FAD/NAD-P-binding domain-containing protein [Mycena rosella]|uniref:FAD/NAD-P-binding domain-containing protein n=1 Tax=Mycena rosella TaxID=1033263 RepID=A0AAD7GD18_MYCRO|nr:FAD/NAD-P-binding domain-containing protein [Mycena rosella]
MFIDHLEVASSWLRRFSTSLVSFNAESAAASFHDDGFLRDILTFTWSNRTLSGRGRIAPYLQANLSKASIHAVRLDDRPNLVPEFTEATSSVASGFTFETSIGPGQGYFSLNPTTSGEWLAMSVLMTLKDIRGHEEAGPEAGTYGDHTLSWTDIARERRLKIEQDPHVLIIGAGQTGLNMGARFKQMNIPALIVEKNARVGDNWRERYPTLTLHSINRQAELLYQAYNRNWPIFTPRDKLAHWLEQYAESLDLVVWTKSRALPTPTYDLASKRWTVVINHDGQRVTIHPVHIVIAAGTLGAPQIPVVQDPERFKGITLHAGYYQGAAPFAGKRVIVIGAGNSAADICQDASFHGCAVTMVQRSSTCVISAANVRVQAEQLWPESTPTDVADFKLNAMPLLLLKRVLSAHEAEAWEAEKETHKGLREAGLKLNMGSDGSGPYPLMFERFGGFWLDVGCAKLIRDGKVKVKQGVEAARFTEDSLVFTDGSSLPADVVIYATSYQSIRDNMRTLFSDRVIDQTSPLWGIDGEGEVRGCYRASGHPGLWFAAGNFAVSRFYSKQMVLEIKAIELGLYKD